MKIMKIINNLTCKLQPCHVKIANFPPFNVYSIPWANSVPNISPVPVNNFSMILLVFITILKFYKNQKTFNLTLASKSISILNSCSGLNLKTLALSSSYNIFLLFYLV